MAVAIQCPKCAAKYKVGEDKVGHSARCTKCGEKFKVAGTNGSSANVRAAAPAQSETPRPSKTPTQGAPPPLPGTSQEAPKRIGKYVIRRKLGAGGMGEVWLGHDADLQRDVAVKVLPMMSRDEEMLKRFIREARLAAKLHHSNTVTVYEVGVDGKLVFIAMELVDGQSLDRTVETRGALSWREATQAVCDAATGLAAAHELGLVHRDIKPANLMRTTKGMTKVVDFGLARAELANSRLTMDETILGTPAYMAPEQWVGGNADARTDIYSLTCTYYHLLTGKQPFQAPTFAALGYQHRHEPLPDPRQFVADLPDAVCQILLRGAGKAPEARFQTAHELREVLSAVLAAPGTLSAKTPWQRLASPTKKSGEAGERQSALARLREKPLVTMGLAIAVSALVAVVAIFALSRSGEQKVANVGSASAGEKPALVPQPGQMSQTAPESAKPAVEPVASTERAPEPAVAVKKGPEPVVENVEPEKPSPAGPVALSRPTPVTKPAAIAQASDAAAFDDANLEFLDEVEAKFTPVGAAEGAKIEEARAKTLGDVQSKTFELSKVFSSMMGSSAPKQLGMPIQPTRGTWTNWSLPGRFVLTGKLGAVRVQGGNTWVFLWLGQREAFEPQGARGNGWPFLPIAGIQFADSDMTPWLADYHIGDEVRVVVARGGNAKDQDNGERRDPRAPRIDPMERPTGTPWFTQHGDEFQRFDDGMLYWTLTGEGIEKPNRPETWVDRKLGRAGRLLNEQEVQRSPGQLLRNLPGHFGSKGIVAAKFQSVNTAESGGKVSLKLEISTAREGPLSVMCEMPSSVSAKDFLSFQAGDEVLAAIRIKGAETTKAVTDPKADWKVSTLAGLVQLYTRFQPGIMSMRGLGPGMGPTMGMGASPAGAPASGGTDPLTAWFAIVADCTRMNKANDPSSLVAASAKPRQTGEIALTPAAAANNLDGTVGLEVTWTGKLRQVKIVDDETRLLVQCEDDVLSSFEAFAPGANFIDQLRDYISETERRDGPDRVTVRGKLVSTSGRRHRLQFAVPLLEITDVERAGHAESRAKPGEKRAENSFAAGRLSQLEIALRNSGIEGAGKWASAVGIDVTWSGRLEDIQAIDGETHLIVADTLANPPKFECLTAAKDFLAQLSDYGTRAEDLDDKVIVKGKIVAADSAARLGKGDVPLVELAEIQRVDHPESRAEPGRVRDKETFDPKRKLPDLWAMLRDPPAAGTKVKFRVFFKSAGGTEPVSVEASATKSGSRGARVRFTGMTVKDFADFKRDELVEITGTVKKVDPRLRWQSDFEGESISHAAASQ